MTIDPDLIVLAIRGTLKPTSLEEACAVHNQTAGNPHGVAAARALGDLSHNVFVPLADGKNAATELLFLDIWNSGEGLPAGFFADPQVQGGAEMMFKSRDPIVAAAGASTRSYGCCRRRRATARSLRRLVARDREVARRGEGGVRQAPSRRRSTRAGSRPKISHQVFFKLGAPNEGAIARAPRDRSVDGRRRDDEDVRESSPAT